MGDLEQQQLSEAWGVPAHVLGHLGSVPRLPDRPEPRYRLNDLPHDFRKPGGLQLGRQARRRDFVDEGRQFHRPQLHSSPAATSTRRSTSRICGVNRARNGAWASPVAR